MARQVEAVAYERGYRPLHHHADDPADPAVLAAMLVATLEQALRAAHRLIGALGTTAAHRTIAAGEPASRTPSGGLSRREVEVLRLLAAGRSTRQIAATLALSPRTVQRHVANLYLKIGTHCRAEATAYALRHHLT